MNISILKPRGERTSPDDFEIIEEITFDGTDPFRVPAIDFIVGQLLPINELEHLIEGLAPETSSSEDPESTVIARC